MKRILAKQFHYKSLINILRRHPEFAEGKAQLQRMVAELESREKRMSEILSDICRPVSIFYAVKRQAEKEMNESMFRFTNLGRMAAWHKQDETMYTVMKKYQEQLYKVSTYRLYLNAINVAELLQTLDTNLGGPDFHSRQLPAFRRQAEEFGTKFIALANQLHHRKALKKELSELIASTNLFLRDEMDNAVNFLQDSNPGLYREYYLIRQPHERKRRTTKKSLPVAQETDIKKVQVNHVPSPKQVAITAPETKLLLNEKSVEKACPTPLQKNLVIDEAIKVLENGIPKDYFMQVLELISLQKT
jgi:hypothetical protein